MAPKKKTHSSRMFCKASGWQEIGKGKSASVFLSQLGKYIAVVGRTKFYLRTLSKKLRSTNFSDLPDGSEIVMRCASKWNKGQTCTNTVGRFFWDSKNNFKYKVKPAQCRCENLKLIGQYTPLLYTELQQLRTTSRFQIILTNNFHQSSRPVLKKLFKDNNH